MDSREFTDKLLQSENKLYYFALHLTQNPDDAKDLVQETFCKALIRYSKNPSPVSNFQLWVSRIMKNTFIDQYRSSQSKHNYVEQVVNPRQKFAWELSSVESKLIIEDLKKPLETLPTCLKNSFVLYAVKGYTAKEVAQELGVTHGTVKSFIYKSRKRLQPLLEDYRFNN